MMFPPLLGGELDKPLAYLSVLAMSYDGDR